MAAHGVVFPFFIVGTSKAPRSWLLKAIREISAECYEKGFRVFGVYLRKNRKSEAKLASLCLSISKTHENLEVVHVAGELSKFITVTERLRAVNE